MVGGGVAAIVIPSSGECPSPPLGILESVGFAVDLQNMAAVGAHVERGPGEPLAPENLDPVLEGEVRRGDEAVAMMSKRSS